MKVNVDRQGWEIVEGATNAATDGATALKPATEAHPTPRGSGVPGSGVYAKTSGVAIEPQADVDLAGMDTIPAPSSDGPPVAIPAATTLPSDLFGTITLEDHDTED